MRVFPHYQDTGGFFITLLRKKANPEKEKKFEAGFFYFHFIFKTNA